MSNAPRQERSPQNIKPQEQALPVVADARINDALATKPQRALLSVLVSLLCVSLIYCVPEQDEPVEPATPTPPTSPQWQPMPDSPCGVALALGILSEPKFEALDEAWCAERLIFVDAESNGGDGGRSRPFRTLSEAARAAKDRPITKAIILRGKGVYTSPSHWPDGVSLIGGFYQDWRYQPHLRAHLQSLPPKADAPTVGARLDLITRATTWANLQLRAADAAPGQSSYGLVISRSYGIKLWRVDLMAGRGGDGADGADGSAGLHGAPGSAGMPGASLHVGAAASWPGMGGLASRSSCRPESAQGAGGEGAAPQHPATAGLAAPYALGGAPGFDGHDAPPWDEPAARGGAGGLALGSWQDELLWTPSLLARGQDGLDGLPGLDGGGGGGALLSPGSSYIAPGGGAGGAGGCPGRAGLGGQPGGSSIALVLLDSEATSLHHVNLYNDTPGRGGAGGQGGAGGLGGDGGQGGEQICANVTGLDKPAYEACQPADLPAGDGGRGGDAQDGGGGGGGAGGNSAALVCVGSAAPYMLAVSMSAAPGGQGGQAGGPTATAGQRGTSHATLDCDKE